MYILIYVQAQTVVKVEIKVYFVYLTGIIHSFKDLLQACFMPGIVPGAWNISMNKNRDP